MLPIIERHEPENAIGPCVMPVALGGALHLLAELPASDGLSAFHNSYVELLRLYDQRRSLTENGETILVSVVSNRIRQILEALASRRFAARYR